MISKQFRARMRDKLIERYIKFASHSRVGAPDKETLDFLPSIEGKEVELIVVGFEVFEKSKNIWLPDCLWDEILEYMDEPDGYKDDEPGQDLLGRLGTARNSAGTGKNDITY